MTKYNLLKFTSHWSFFQSSVFFARNVKQNTLSSLPLNGHFSFQNRSHGISFIYQSHAHHTRVAENSVRGGGPITARELVSTALRNHKELPRVQKWRQKWSAARVGVDNSLGQLCGWVPPLAQGSRSLATCLQLCERPSKDKG